ncbi:polycomb protein Asx isoform X2 [Scaptodrosophila lebanonensis]|uniref:Polycomb protein Asx isoform X2 n=1 Tax=Drosophila lebanonensis TaxID=7225 RepID=A0A6J2TMN2_DROLE|nr:polycomb protein Asx isoform X2 [Scaptodrosophila lebanonensis]
MYEIFIFAAPFLISLVVLYGVFKTTEKAHITGTHANATQATPILNLEIGGLVTNMHKSFLQDTSPPSSICSSMNNERMNNSLITSADFTNLNFLQSTQSLESDLNVTTTLTTATTLEGYTLSDMIRDRKALDSLTMSGDGTLIKDSHIGQIDDISLTLSKTASGYSTMDNSTESMSTTATTTTTHNECNNRNANRTLPVCTALQRTMILGDEMIGDTTFNLVDSSMNTPTTDVPNDANATFKKPNALPLNETLLFAGLPAMNTTYTDVSGGVDGTPEARCETPENMSKLNFESTPLTSNVKQQYFSHNNNNKQQQLPHPQYTPNLKGRGGDDVNLSPIVAPTPQKSTRLLNNTYEPAASSFDGKKLIADTTEMLDQIEHPLDGTYNMAEQAEQDEMAKQMQCVMDLAEAEVELLTQQDDEEQFEHMLAELGKVNALNAEQLKMKKSLESIKRRFNNVTVDEPSISAHLNVTLELKAPELNTNTNANSSTMLSSHSSSSGSGSERLLSRRSRLYDDVNLSALQSNSCNSTSFIVQHKEEEKQKPQSYLDQPTDEACTPLQEEEQEQQSQQQTGAFQTLETDVTSYKLTERRERDRERFKTIKITKEMREDQQKIIVPCIDDDVVNDERFEQQQQQQQEEIMPTQQRLSRRERSQVFNPNKNNNSSNYLTYKKPKEKAPLTQHQLPNVQPIDAAPRSLSRPRYISGLQKFSTVTKATSAGAGLNATTCLITTTTPAVPATSIRTTTTGSSELKSPMGIKSKSFHNLSSNISVNPALAAPRGSLGGLRRPGQTKPMSGIRAPTAAQQQTQQQQLEADETSVFKVPKLVSGLRAPTGTGKRAVGNGLTRPSSGYYSLSVAGKSVASTEAETPESLSSASSRGSLYGKEGGKANGNTFDTQTLTSRLTQVTTGASGIPKPSGLRQPTQMKRSGLPRPSSIARR